MPKSADEWAWHAELHHEILISTSSVEANEPSFVNNGNGIRRPKKKQNLFLREIYWFFQLPEENEKKRVYL
jgi:hypothetical protein